MIANPYLFDSPLIINASLTENFVKDLEKTGDEGDLLVDKTRAIVHQHFFLRQG